MKSIKIEGIKGNSIITVEAYPRDKVKKDYLNNGAYCEFCKKPKLSCRIYDIEGVSTSLCIDCMDYIEEKINTSGYDGTKTIIEDKQGEK